MNNDERKVTVSSRNSVAIAMALKVSAFDESTLLGTSYDGIYVLREMLEVAEGCGSKSLHCKVRVVSSPDRRDRSSGQRRCRRIVFIFLRDRCTQVVIVVVDVDWLEFPALGISMIGDMFLISRITKVAFEGFGEDGGDG